ncbi:hypothetical protein [Cohnella panacarvi]|uniref:hypothetical protein n=1 Tax=Cohnella panacarvi TaxID=400776 RepID=UPI00047A4512|nr:hypothetical protein [Cohnella panacarvi]
MSQIKINVNDVRAVNKTFKRMIGRMGDERDDLSSLRRRLDGDITRRRNIDSRMSQAGSKLGDLQTQLQALYNFIDYGMDEYIQADEKAKDHPFEKKKKKSVWDKIGGAINAAADGVTGFVEGVADAVIGTVEGIFNMVVHPIQTIQGLVYVVTHPVDVAVGIWNAVSESWNNDVVNGDAQSRGKWFGRMIGEVALAAVGTKGVDKVGKLAKGSKIVQEAGGVRVVPEVLRGRMPGVKRDMGTPAKPEVEGTPSPSLNKPGMGAGSHKKFTGAGMKAYDKAAEAEYELIRKLGMKDIEDVARNTGHRVDEIRAMKKHLFFGKHQIPQPGGKEFRLERFAADDEIAFAWKTVQKGELSPEQKAWFRQLGEHELAERKLMAEGHKYRTLESWNKQKGTYDGFPPGAHEKAPPQPNAAFPGYEEYFFKNMFD